METLNVAVIGTGYVGLTTGVALAYLGHKVTCVDLDTAKLERLRQGKTPIYEPHLEELMLASGANLHFTDNYAEAIPQAQVVFIAVGTPPLPDGNPDLKYLQSAAHSIGQHLGLHFTVVINKSTVPIGSGNWVDSLVRERRIGTGNFAVASNPEFLREGSALSDTLYADRIVVGADDRQALEALYTLYRPIIEQAFEAPYFLPRPENVDAVPFIATDIASAELIKYAANAFLSVKISFINEIAALAEKVGADVKQIARGIGLDARIGSRFLHAGIGWGGSCFGKDTAALVANAKDYRLGMPIVQAAREVNYRQRERMIEKLLDELKILKGRTIGLLGLAFKPHTDDLRDAPALDIAQKLIERGVRVKAHDPIAMENFAKQYASMGMHLCSDVAELAQGADALILVTEWPEYRELAWNELAQVMRKPLVLDGRNHLDPERLMRSGFRYLAVGRSFSESVVGVR